MADSDDGGRVGRPLLWLCVAFAGGAGWGIAHPWHGWAWLFTAPVCLVVCAAFRFGGRRALVAGLGVAFALGAARSSVEVVRWERQPLRACLGMAVLLEGEVLSATSELSSGGTRYDLGVQRIKPPDGPWRALRGRVRVGHAGTVKLQYGDRVCVAAVLEDAETAGNPGEFSFRRALRADHLGAVCWRSPPPQVVGHGGGWRVVRWSHRLRVALTDHIARAMPGPAAPQFAELLTGLVFGVRAAGVEPALAEAFRRAGVMHVLVASGTQVSLLLACVYFVSLRLRLPPQATVLLAVALIVPYTLIAGAQASIVRAALMGLMVMGALVSGQDYDLPLGLAASAGAILLWNPLQLESVGFQLSYAACIGLVGFGLPWSERAPQWVPKRLAQLACMTVGAQLFVAPLMVWHFRSLSPIGLVSNLPVIPVSGVLVVTGLAASLCGGVLTWVAWLLNWVSHAILAWMLCFVGWCAGVGGGYLQPFAMTPAELAGAALLLGVACLAVAPAGLPRLRRRQWLLLGLAFLAACLGYALFREAKAGLTVAVMDVGEGDSILVTGPTGRRLLVDGGRRYEREGQVVDDGLDRVVPALMLSGVTRLDAMVGTHQHEDHIGGLRTVLRAYQPRQLLLPDLPRTVPAVAELLEEAKLQRVPVGRLVRGQELDLGGGARAYVLWPPVTPVRGTGSDENNNAVVLKVVYKQVSFLLASDLEEVGEKLLMQMPGDLSATVLKVPHQGSADSSTAAFLKAVRPAYAVVTVGPNVFGHPSPATLVRLQATGARLHRTDRDGLVKYRTDGRTVSVHTFGRR